MGRKDSVAAGRRRWTVGLFFGLGATAVLPTVHAEVRTWTDVSGGHKVEAEFVESKGGKVTLKTSSGKTVQLPIAKLSAADRRHVADLLAAKGAAERRSPEQNELRALAAKFFEGLRKDDRSSLAPLLVAQARTGLQAGASPVSNLPKPDEGRSIRVGKITIDGNKATVGVRLLIEKETYATTLSLVKQDQGWGIASLEASRPDGTKKLIEFAPGAGADDFAVAGNDAGPLRSDAPASQLSPDAQPANNASDDESGDAASRERLAALGLAPPPSYESLASAEGQAEHLATEFSPQPGFPPQPALDPENASTEAIEAEFEQTDAVLQASKDPAELTAAVQQQLPTLSLLAFVDPPAAEARIKTLRQTAKKHQLEEVQRDIETVVLKLHLMRSGPATDVRPQLEKASQLLADGPVGPQQLSLAQIAAPLVVRLPANHASRLLAKLGEPLVVAEGPAAALGNRMLADSRRLGLMGKELPLSGVRLDGSPLDPSAWAGKVVLVDFWATWCGPCKEELPNVRENYAKYRDQGFEVVGVSLDDDLAALEQFTTTEELPWIIVAERHPQAQGERPLSAICGVTGIPTALLLGRDGKVVAIDARGARLGELLEKHL